MHRAVQIFKLSEIQYFIIRIIQYENENISHHYLNN